MSKVALKFSLYFYDGLKCLVRMLMKVSFIPGLARLP